MDCSRIFPRLWLGARLHGEDEIDRLAQETRANAIVSLLTDEDLLRLGIDWISVQAHCDRRRIELRSLPVRDGDTGDLRDKLPDCVRSVCELLDAGRTVYLHCTAGIERSPTVAVAYLHWCMGYELDEAAAYVSRCRGCSPDVGAITLATLDLLRSEAVRGRIEKVAGEFGGAAGPIARKEAQRRILREIILERNPTRPTGLP